MTGSGRTPRYAVRLVAVLLVFGVVFFGGLRLFIPDGSKLTGSYDAASLLYIAAQPVSYAGSSSCGASNCHESLFNTWSAGAHGARAEQSKCEVCHGPQGNHPEPGNKLQQVRGDGKLVELCLSCHQKLKARSTTGQPQIIPQEHPYPHEGVLVCTQCHDPHAPGIGAPGTSVSTDRASMESKDTGGASAADSLAVNCFGCHGQAGRGGFAPELAGKPYEQIKDKLTKFRSGEINSPMMNPVASGMKDDDIEALARYFAGVS
jgi:cytochrome c553